MALEEEQHRAHEGEIQQEKRALKVQLKEMELAHQDATKTLKMVSNLLSFPVWTTLDDTVTCRNMTRQ